ncbi:LytTR family transcriptional regulator DNA-binding domain-containing protein [Catenovulum sp. 2E275]|uniref:LytR/AlgR family response regulator transcription factor n=1 Tax=Catenovulum sp. 2E275 TaxID=2980497 RepID=UPI0021CFC836|nr:LytTR family transcriptional regulator DNA-binding domain-containing protein [Catenovulum sp. 2E275]MCU4674051.1 LytTR family transcriptional regulator DNA-binding domain-containing protein [Catenovulum sp. 2E275]
MNKIKTLIVDDELGAIEGLAIRLSAFEQIEVVATAGSVKQALVEIKQTNPDLIFLDIEMPNQSGFDLIAELQADKMPAIVFVTAYHQHAVKAFEVRAVDYLLKPVNQQRLAESIARVESSQQGSDKNQLLSAYHEIEAKSEPRTSTLSANTDKQKLVVQDGRNTIQLVPYPDIQWIDAAGDYMCVHTSKETYVMRARLKSLTDQLPDYFMRIHKSTIVNLTQINQLQPLSNSEYSVILQNGKNLKVSRTYSKELKLKFV